MKPEERSRNRTRKLFWCPKFTQNGLNSGCRCCFSDIFHSSSKISGLRERGGNLQSEICGKQECELALLHYCSELLRESGSKERREEAWGHWFVRTSRYFLILPDVPRYHSKFQWPTQGKLMATHKALLWLIKPSDPLFNLFVPWRILTLDTDIQNNLLWTQTAILNLRLLLPQPQDYRENSSLEEAACHTSSHLRHPVFSYLATLHKQK